MSAFVAIADLGGFSAAARKLNRSPASVTRAVSSLEERVGTELLRRTTRVVKLTEAGERYLASCRRILGELALAEQVEVGEAATPRGILTVTAPSSFGRIHVRPLVDTYLKAHAEVRVHLLLLDRLVNLVDEGVDVAIRIAHLPDSSLLAVRVGEVSRVVCASPAYLAQKSKIKHPADLSLHESVSFSQQGTSGGWAFAGARGGRASHIKMRSRLTVNSVDAAIASVVEGHGVTRVLSYQIEHELKAGRLVKVLAAFEPDPLPVYVVYPAASGTTAKVRAFVDLAVGSLRNTLGKAARRAI